MGNIVMSLLLTVGLLSTTSSFAANKFGFALDQGFGITGQFDNINAFIGNDGLSGDYIFNQGSFSEDIPFNWYVGGGAYYNWKGKDSIGARLPLGLTLSFAPKWDLYGQVSPTLDLEIDDMKFKFGVDFALGVRYAF